MQAKTDLIAANSGRVGLRINREKTKVLRINHQDQEPNTVYGLPLEEVLELFGKGKVNITTRIKSGFKIVL